MFSLVSRGAFYYVSLSSFSITISIKREKKKCAVKFFFSFFASAFVFLYSQLDSFRRERQKNESVWGKDDDGFSSLYEFLCAGRNVTKRRKSARRDEVHFFSITTTTTITTITTMRRGDEREREREFYTRSFFYLFLLSLIARARVRPVLIRA